MRIGVKSSWRRLRDAVICTMGIAGATLDFVGCSSSDTSTSPKLGTLTVTITAPSEVTPSVTVIGPGYSTSLSATATLGRLPVGPYRIAAAVVASNDPIASTIDSAVIDRDVVSVTANATATATVSYNIQRPGTGGLWVANSGRAQSVAEYAAAKLATSAGSPPTAWVATGDPRPYGIAFDRAGNLWVALSHGNLIAEYSIDQLEGVNPNTATPAMTLSANAGSLNQPAGIAFDLAGNLWVTNAAANTVVGFSALQLAGGGGLTPLGAGGAQTPAVTIGTVAGSLNAPLALAFDNNGNLWVANTNANTVVEFSTAQLVASGNPAPVVTLSAAAGSIAGPTGLAIDYYSDLWVANGNTGQNTLVEFSPSQLSSSGAPTPTVILGTTAGSLVSPTGLAFDNSGSLWVSNANNTVVAFTINQQLSSGSPAPAATFTTNSLMNAPIGGIAFDPAQIPAGPYDCATCPYGALRLR